MKTLTRQHLRAGAQLTNAGESGFYKVWTWLQRTGAALGLLFCLPLLGVAWIFVKLTSPGPFLFKQKRVGRNDQIFTVYKIRTMSLGSEKATALGVSDRGPQVTLAGRVFRTLKIDEIPQFWNVLRGDMLLIGPRPIPLSLDEELRRLIPGFAERYRVSPGLSILGQICIYDNDAKDNLEGDWRLRFESELHYLRHRCVAYDLTLLAMTLLFLGKKLAYFFTSKTEKSTSNSSL